MNLASLTTDRLPSLDGWRALSIILVLGEHCLFVHNFPAFLAEPFDWFFDGNLGVRIFFVISGFLITWLLLREDEKTGRVSLGNFYKRRALRILPVYTAFLAVVALLQLVTTFHQGLSMWLTNLTFTTGFVVFGERGWSLTTFHLWSLAIEEQFYLIWPALVAWMALAKKPRLAFAVLAVPIVLAPAARVLVYLNLVPVEFVWLVNRYTFFVNSDSLALGCAAAILFFRRFTCIQSLLIRRSWAVLAIGVLCLVGPQVLVALFLFAPFTVPLGPTVQACGSALLIMQSICLPDFFVFRLLNIAVVAWFGGLSYSIYIWQQLFLRDAALGLGGGTWWNSFPAWLLAAVCLAAASYYLLEKPFMSLRSRLRS